MTTRLTQIEPRPSRQARPPSKRALAAAQMAYRLGVAEVIGVWGLGAPPSARVIINRRAHILVQVRSSPFSAFRREIYVRDVWTR
jgi:hypothetical protein